MDREALSLELTLDDDGTLCAILNCRRLARFLFLGGLGKRMARNRGSNKPRTASSSFGGSETTDGRRGNHQDEDCISSQASASG